MKMLLAVLLASLLCVSGSVSADTPPMAIDNGGSMEFVHAVRTGTLSSVQRAALEARLDKECQTPTNPITQGMIETRGPAKCMAFVRNQCSCTDCEMPTYCLPAQ